MSCGELVLDGNRVCVEQLTDPLACAVVADGPGWPDPCPELQDQGSCDALVSTSGGYACTWVTQQLFELPAEACVPLEIVEKCVLTQLTDTFGEDCGGVATQAGYCDASDVRVVFEDLGPGTARLTSYNGCNRFPAFEFWSSDWGLCDFSGAVSIPVFCECACPGP